MSDYRNLKVWNRTLDFVSQVYQLTLGFPTYELYGLTSQIRRAATSISLNIAEGATSGYDAEFVRFIRLAIRSANEVAAGFEIAKRLEYCEAYAAQKQIQEADQIASMLQGLARSLKSAGETQTEYEVSTSNLFKLDSQFLEELSTNSDQELMSNN
ncbi:MAG TPA: four helix bundle protein [Anaerolineae bacterium]|nr:four helix bundle protein [Anaerolineae bacterium]